MKSRGALIAAFCIFAAAGNMVSGGTLVYEIQACIDGRDLLYIQGDTLQWEHLDYAAVGRYQGNNQPTYISAWVEGNQITNQAAWTPQWPEEPPAEIRYYATSSIFTELLPALPAYSEITSVEVTKVSGVLEIGIYEMPSEENQGLLIVDFNDNEHDGTCWYLVRITVGYQDIPTPDVAGMTQADAVTAITSAGLEVGTITQHDSATVPAGSVIRQTPVAGVSVYTGYPVDMVISSGVYSGIPDVMNMPQEDAQSEIVSAGYITGVVTREYSESVSVGYVISQTPAAGTPAEPGSSVDLVISRGKAITIPDITGMPQVDAESILYSSGLVLGTIQTAYDRSVQELTVLTQSLAAGQIVPAGTAINMVIAGGQGWEDDPFNIWTAEQFNSISQNPDDWGSHFILIADIDMSGMMVTPVWEFSGIFEGNGHTISNVVIQQPNDEYVGLFGTLSGQINNLNLVDVDILGLHHIGGLAGYNSSGTIYACSVTGSVSGMDGSYYIGGLCGTNDGYGTISRSYANCSVTAGNASSTLGGLCGFNLSGTIINCYADGSVTGGEYLGGLCGTNEDTLSECYTTCYISSVTNSFDLGGLCGISYSEINNCFWDTDTSGLTEEYFDDMGLPTSLMQTQSTFTDAGWDFVGETDNGTEDIWTMPSDSYPVLSRSANLPVEMPVFSPDGGTYNIGQTVTITCGTVGATIHYTTNGVDPTESDPVVANGDTVSVSVNPATTLKAIAFVTDKTPSAIKSATYSFLPYSGGDGSAGNPYKIATKADLLALAATTTDYNQCFILTADIDMAPETFTQAVIAPDTNISSSGFQGTAFTGVFDGNDKKISNLLITSTTHDYVGLFGRIGPSGQIKNLGLVDTSIQGHICVGGLAGENFGSSITLCYATGTVSGTSYYVGGLVGDNYSGSITSCHATSSVSGSHDVGGLAGGSWSTITSSYATGPVSGNASTGGLVGGNNNEGSITLCYATGSVIGTGYDSYRVGGLVGDNDYTITSCYATGNVSGVACVGGLVGYNGYYSNESASGSHINSCYATGTVSGSNAVGGLVGYNSGHNNWAWINSCYATGTVSGNSDTGGLVGNNDATTPSTILSSFWDKDTSGKTTSDGGTEKITIEMKTLATFTGAGWDFVGETANGTADTWKMRCEGMNYPKLTWQTVLAADWVCPDGVAMEDFGYLAARWLRTDCALTDNCEGADLNHSGIIETNNLITFAAMWMEGQ